LAAGSLDLCSDLKRAFEQGAEERVGRPKRYHVFNRGCRRHCTSRVRRTIGSKKDIRGFLEAAPQPMEGVWRQKLLGRLAKDSLLTLCVALGRNEEPRRCWLHELQE